MLGPEQTVIENAMKQYIISYQSNIYHIAVPQTTLPNHFKALCSLVIMATHEPNTYLSGYPQPVLVTDLPNNIDWRLCKHCQGMRDTSGSRQKPIEPGGEVC